MWYYVWMNLLWEDELPEPKTPPDVHRKCIRLYFPEHDGWEDRPIS